jgi:hypothetical protein
VFAMRDISAAGVFAIRASTKDVTRDTFMKNAFRMCAAGMAALVTLLGCLIGATAFAVGADDLGTARSIVRDQEEAFARDDASAAYGFAAPGIQLLYPSPDGFMSMVRNAYAPVYRHRSFDFGEARIVDGKILQEVQIVDADGVAWDAIYTLETQPDGSLKISACVLKKAVISGISPPHFRPEETDT